MRATHPHREDVLWMLASIVLRLPLSFLPAPGRDEATYFNWAMQEHGAYAPLMLSTVRVAHAFGLAPLFAIRVPTLVVGTLLVWAIARHLRLANATPAWCALGVGAVVLSPWFVYSGAILHPDMWLSVCVVGAATGWMMRSPWAAAAWAGSAALAKPSGVFIGAGVGLLLLADRAEPLRRRGIAAALAVGGAVAALLALGPDRVDALGTLARLDPSIPLASRAAVAAALMLVAAPAVLVFAIDGARRPARSREWVFAAVTAGVWGTWLLLALFTRGQFKANWWLPGLLPLALAARPISTRLRAMSWGVVAIGAVISVSLLLAFTAPRVLERAEAGLGFGATYRWGAGGREEEVSGTSTWAERVREYRTIDAFVAAVDDAIGDAVAGSEPPSRIVTDDYGLAAQLAFAWGGGSVELDVRGDAMQPTPTETVGRTLWLWRSEAWAKRHGAPAAAARLAHPSVAGSEVFVAIGNRGAAK